MPRRRAEDRATAPVAVQAAQKGPVVHAAGDEVADASGAERGLESCPKVCASGATDVHQYAVVFDGERAWLRTV